MSEPLDLDVIKAQVQAASPVWRIYQERLIARIRELEPRTLVGDWESVRDALDALPDGAVIKWQSHDGTAVAIKRRGRWAEAGYPVTRTVASIARDNTPIEVIA